MLRPLLTSCLVLALVRPPVLQRAQTEVRPDVVVILTDQQRADALGVAGTPGVVTFLKRRQAAAGPGRRPLLMMVSFLNPHQIYQVNHQLPFGRPVGSKLDLPASLADDLSTKPAPQREYRDEDEGRSFRHAKPA